MDEGTSVEELETFTAGNEQAIVNYTAAVINRLTLHGVNAGKHRSQLAEFSAEEIATQCVFKVWWQDATLFVYF